MVVVPVLFTGHLGGQHVLIHLPTPPGQPKPHSLGHLNEEIQHVVVLHADLQFVAHTSTHAHTHANTREARGGGKGTARERMWPCIQVHQGPHSGCQVRENDGHRMVSSGFDKPNAAVVTQPRRLQSVTMMGEQAEPTAALPTFTAMGTMTTRIAMARHAAFTILNCFIEEREDSQRNHSHRQPANDCDVGGREFREAIATLPAQLPAPRPP